jgi:hypothetical protein
MLPPSDRQFLSIGCARAFGLSQKSFLDRGPSGRRVHKGKTRGAPRGWRFVEAPSGFLLSRSSLRSADFIDWGRSRKAIREPRKQTAAKLDEGPSGRIPCSCQAGGDSSQTPKSREALRECERGNEFRFGVSVAEDPERVRACLATLSGFSRSESPDKSHSCHSLLV